MYVILSNEYIDKITTFTFRLRNSSIVTTEDLSPYLLKETKHEECKKYHLNTRIHRRMYTHTYIQSYKLLNGSFFPRKTVKTDRSTVSCRL